jgi:hypothetical protein
MNNRKNSPESSAVKWAEDALNSLDGISRASANPFLYTKIMARLDAANSGWEKVANWLSKPAFAFASIAIFVSINIAVIMNGLGKSEAALVQKGTVEQMLAAEFSNSQSYSLIEINEDK